ncbi:hypothetical protein NUSPORA_02016 [Nucleospora cyclopteri]
MLKTRQLQSLSPTDKKRLQELCKYILYDSESICCCFIFIPQKKNVNIDRIPSKVLLEAVKYLQQFANLKSREEDEGIEIINELGTKMRAGGDIKFNEWANDDIFTVVKKIIKYDLRGLFRHEYAYRVVEIYKERINRCYLKAYRLFYTLNPTAQNLFLELRKLKLSYITNKQKEDCWEGTSNALKTKNTAFQVERSITLSYSDVVDDKSAFIYNFTDVLFEPEPISNIHRHFAMLRQILGDLYENDLEAVPYFFLEKK